MARFNLASSIPYRWVTPQGRFWNQLCKMVLVQRCHQCKKIDLGSAFTADEMPTTNFMALRDKPGGEFVINLRDVYAAAEPGTQLTTESFLKKKFVVVREQQKLVA